MVRKKPVTTRNDPVTTPASDVRRLIRFAGDVSPEPAQSLVKTRVPAVDVVCMADRRDAVGNQPGDDQSRTRSDIAGLDGGAGCLLYTSPSPRDGLLSRMPSSA